tara:strand:- start:10628 stop:11224 length:597 start_codon:yes stop_codon:yes gene_type:complete
MKIGIVVYTLLIGFALSAQMSEDEILEHRAAHSKGLMDPEKKVLRQDEIEEFGGLDYFQFDSTYQITATFKKSKGKKFEMPTSTDRLPVYRRYGYITFQHENHTCTLEVYQNIALKRKKQYRKSLFIPFRDKTSRRETYGGGRYLDAQIPDSEMMQLDFNLAYNPYCAYSHRYSCPIPPEENTLNVSILAGEKTPLAH